MKWLFGVMSNKYSLQADDELVAHTAMAVFIGQNVPIAIYKPKEGAISPLKILQNPSNDHEAVKTAIRTIKTVKL